MVHVPDVPPRPIAAITTLGEYRAANLVVISHCSAGHGHTYVVDLNELIALHGEDCEVDHAFKVGLRCPECGASGGGLEIRLPG